MKIKWSAEREEIQKNVWRKKEERENIDNHGERQQDQHLRDCF
jgi:hypothetical protein